MIIRSFEEGDWAAICAIHDAARPDELRGSCDPRAFVPIEKDAEVKDLRRSDKYVAVQDGRVVGFVGVDDKYLAWLYVHPAFYHQGIGRQLLAKGLEMIGEDAWTIVLDGNRPAIRLYESAGFQEARRYQSDNAGYPCTCLRMERDG